MQSTRPTTTQRRRPGGRRFFPRRKVCQFCVDKVTIDYKDISRNRRFISEWGKIESRRKTGTCSPHQRQLALAIKRGRFLAMLPYTGGHSLMDLSRPDPRGDRGRRPFRGAPPTDGAPPPGTPTFDLPGASTTTAAPVAEAPAQTPEAPATPAVTEAPATEPEAPAEPAVDEAPATEPEAPAEPAVDEAATDEPKDAAEPSEK